ncbi:MAG: NUDIX domain-containing protein [bacterium]|jgi:8-oxo-dGTP diphosphatase
MGKVRIRNRVAVIVIKKGKILLVQHHKKDRKYWLLPGGGVNYGETLADAARRELEEETGLNALVGDLLFISESIPPDGHRHVVNYYFEGRLQGGDLCVGEDSQLCAVEWHEIEDLPHLLFYPNVTPEILEWISTGNIQRRSLGNRWEE